MIHSKSSVAAFVLLLSTAASVAQDASLPKEISGRWTFPAGNRTQTFSLSEVAPAAEKTFTAKLTWWTADPKCTIRNEQINGKLTAIGLTFDAKTKCDISFTAWLNRSGTEWEGEAKTTSGPEVVLKLKAN